MVSDTSIKDQLKKLVELQKLDEQIYALKQDLKEKPEMVNELKEEFESKKGHLKALEEKLKSIQVKRKEHELDLQAKEDNIAKANGQLSDIKTNKEYTAKIGEIENIKADKAQIEEHILLSFDEAEKVTAEIEKEKVIVDKEEKEYLAKKSEVDAQVSQINASVAELDQKRKGLLPEVEAQLLSQYERILNHREGLAIVPVQGGDSCGGCYMNVNPQTVNSIKMYDHIVSCELCSRILYLEEDL